MRFVKRLELLVVVEGTAILKIYTPGPLKVRQIEPAIAMRKLIIDTKRSTRIAGPNGKSRGAANRATSALPPANGTEVGLIIMYLYRQHAQQADVGMGFGCCWLAIKTVPISAEYLQTFARLQRLPWSQANNLRNCIKSSGGPALAVLCLAGCPELRFQYLVARLHLGSQTTNPNYQSIRFFSDDALIAVITFCDTTDR